MRLSVIIVNYRSSTDIINCLQSASRFTSFKEVEWIIVDNNSGDNSKDIITTSFPIVRWIQMNYNAGFARANNEGIRLSAGEVVLLLNPDTIILEDAVYKCFKRFIETSCVACAVQLLNPDQSPQITGNFFMKGGLNHLLPLPYLGRLLRSIAFAAKVKKTNVQQSSTEEKVDWINGAFLMVKKTAINTSGLLDEDFFLYSEEIEWCSRLKKVGPLCVFGDLYTIHLQGESIGKATATTGKGYFNLYDKRGLQLMVSQMIRIRKQFGIGWFLFHLCMFTFEVPVFFICSILDHLIHLQNPFTEWKQIKGFTINLFKTWKLSWTIIQNKPHFYKMF